MTRLDTSRHCCDGRCYQRNGSQGGTCPLLDHHEPVRQRPAPRTRRGLVVGVFAVAFVAAGTLALLAPIQTTNAVAQWVGPR